MRFTDEESGFIMHPSLEEEFWQRLTLRVQEAWETLHTRVQCDLDKPSRRCKCESCSARRAMTKLLMWVE